MRVQSRIPALLVALLTVLVYLPALSLPFVSDDFNSIYQAAVSLQRPAHLVDPWMGHSFRIFPKLGFMAGLLMWGLTVWPYRLVNILIHGLSTFLIARLVGRWSGSHATGIVTALLFGIGFGPSAKSVIQVSNLTMLMGFFFLLLSLHALVRSHWKRAALAYAAAVLSHDITVIALLLVPFLLSLQPGMTGRPGFLERLPRLRRLGPVVAVVLLLLVPLSFLPGRLGELTSMEIRMGSFLLFPMNVQSLQDPGGGVWRSLMEFAAPLVRHRYWIGLGLLVLVSVWVWRRDSLGVLSAAWIYVFFLPAAWLMVHWKGDWLERRYLYIPSLGACLVAARAIVSLARWRRIAAFCLFSVVVLWSLLVNVMIWRKFERDSYSAAQNGLRREFLKSMAELDPRWQR